MGVDFRVIGHEGMAGIYGDGEMKTTRYTSRSHVLCIGVSGVEIMRDGSIGGIGIDSTEAKVMAAAKAVALGKLTRGKDEMWEALGMAGQTWTYTDAGLSLEMLSEKLDGAKSVFSMISPEWTFTHRPLRTTTSADSLPIATSTSVDAHSLQGRISAISCLLRGQFSLFNA